MSTQIQLKIYSNEYIFQYKYIRTNGDFIRLNRQSEWVKSGVKRRNSIADNIRRLRRERGLTQLELAEQAGLSNIAIVQLETGRRTNPRSDTVEAIAKALECSVEDLYRDPKNSKNSQVRSSTRPYIGSDLVRHGPSMEDIGPIMKALTEISAAKRAFVLAVLFEDASLLEKLPLFRDLYDDLMKEN